MSIFGDQSERLLRETWASPSELAEELYAMFGVNTPLQIQGPVQITNPTQQPGLTVTQSFTYDPAAFPPGLTPAPPPGITILTPTADPTPSAVAPSPTSTPVTQNNVAISGGGFPGQVQSGSGATYSVQIYPAGLSGKSKIVQATQLSIDSSETIPAGTWTLVAQAGEGYYMQVPVWGAP